MAVLPMPIELDHPANETSSNSAPRVKLPDVIPCKLVVPGPNSWAQSKELENARPKDTVRTQPTNRDRYEDKPLPKLSLENSHESALQSKSYILPAVPLINTLPQGQKSRAVTDPIQIRSLLTSRKPSISQLKKKGKIFEFASSKLDLTEATDLPHPNVAPKALELLGVQQESTPTQQTAPSQAQTPVPVHSSADNAITRSPILALQVQFDPAPTRRSSSERKDESFIAKASKTASQHSLREQTQSDSLGGDIVEPKRLQAEIINGNLRPSKVPVYGNVGKQYGVVQQQGLHPSGSFHGIIEIASPARTEEHGPEHQELISPTKDAQPEPSGEILRPTIYAPRDYSGVWENDPAVGYTLPPFTPIPKTGHPNHEHVPKGLTVGASNVFQEAFKEKFPRNASAVHGSQAPQVQEASTKVASHIPSGNLTIEPQEVHRSRSRNGLGGSAAQPHHIHRSQSRNGFGGVTPCHQQQYPTQYAQHGLQQAIFDSRTQSIFDHPLNSANSWAPPQGNSLGSSHAPLSAPLPPGWPGHLSHNPVPSPPASQQDYQRPSPLSAGLAQLDLTLHHHIDRVFGSLSRQIADRHDRVLDRVLLRIDNFEEKISRELKGLKVEFNSLRKEIGKLRASVSETTHGHDSILKELQTLSGKINDLEKHTAQVKCKDHIRFIDQSNSGSNADRPQRHFKHRRTESAHGSLGGPLAYDDQCLPSHQKNGTAPLAASRSSSKIRQSGHSNGSRTEGLRSRAGTGSSQQESGVRRAVFAELGMRGENKTVPDVRDHPAYRQQDSYVEKREAMAETGGFSGEASLGEGGWYHQAYGKGI